MRGLNVPREMSALSVAKNEKENNSAELGLDDVDKRTVG